MVEGECPCYHEIVEFSRLLKNLLDDYHRHDRRGCNSQPAKHVAINRDQGCPRRLAFCRPSGRFLPRSHRRDTRIRSRLCWFLVRVYRKGAHRATLRRCGSFRMSGPFNRWDQAKASTRFPDGLDQTYDGLAKGGVAATGSRRRHVGQFRAGGRAIRRGRRALAPLSVGWRHRELILAVLRRELADRFSGSALGWVWAVVGPLITLAIYTMTLPRRCSCRRPRRMAARRAMRSRPLSALSSSA